MNGDESVSPSNVLDLAVLGVAGALARTTAQLVAGVKQIAGARFQPTTDVIAGRIAALSDRGLLTPTPTGPMGDPLWQPSAAGRAHMHRLLLMHGGSPVDALAAVCARLKICFLEMLDPEARGRVVDDLVVAHRRALNEARVALAGCAGRCALVQRCLARDVERWEAEIAWLEALRFEVEGGASLAAPV